ncbi:D-alanyl-D-alanine carboxypeptidase/D-alanyl-D-alanine-endopeptidase [Bacteriovorax sp. PP10]|uniref:D-alanyl-D-alanine carboxypeptidase/D-alanyl-D-alanine-endopeptidase n=1 Tax=Bacteriovorax antarcticus TaxID=3088717 RepID=A0ABU5VV13_9BACT|nr:D-alanyl-D-alanine carboxypeptidase/D-alanyl-D-alanine-endopeptidase [Bacteriovorax sp. PP10]MEA9356883.1 D-alanyl-D-alanine carboxypeptidase/D-alanyl-D-alanine-endopeptidase [Bacteriovorax sp. PP10]
MKLNLFLAFLFTSTSVFAVTEADFKKLIKKHHFNESTLGLYVEADGKSVIDINGGKSMVPASLTKIVTGGAILTKIPLNKKFVTELWSKAPIEGTTLKGALCLKGGGDPSFVSEKMWYLVNEFVRTGVKTIEGDLIIDATRFDSEGFDAGRESVRVDRAYDAPISAMSFNWNSVNVFIRPGDTVNGPAKIFLDPVSDYLELENKTKTVEKSGVKTLEVSRVRLGLKDKIIITGSISKNATEAVVYKSISNPTLWTASHLKEFLKEREITIKGVVKEGECETDSKVLAFVNSKNLNEITSDMLKFSNNYVAEMLVKNLAAETVTKNASMKDGIEAIKTYLDQVGLRRSDYVLENVSGLTRDNRFTPKQLALVLTNIKNDFLIFPEFLSGLPIAGIDGTMKNRLKGGLSLVRAKTGYLDGVVGLAGYIGRQDKGPLVFVFLFNGGFDQGLAARPLFDDLISAILK